MVIVAVLLLLFSVVLPSSVVLVDIVVDMLDIDFPLAAISVDIWLPLPLPILLPLLVFFSSDSQLLLFLFGDFLLRFAMPSHATFEPYCPFEDLLPSALWFHCFPFPFVCNAVDCPLVFCIRLCIFHIFYG